MIDWIRNIVPRIRNYSTDLNKIETLVDKTWIWHEFQEGHSTFHFLRDGRLLITRSGDVEEGIWELIPGGLLHIKGNHFNYMFNHGIVFEGVLLIKKQGIVDNLEVFYDEAIIPNGDFIEYIERKLNEKTNGESHGIAINKTDISSDEELASANNTFFYVLMVSIIILMVTLLKTCSEN